MGEVFKGAYAYTPGLKVKGITVVLKERKLPLPGDVLVEVGDQVSYDTVIAKAMVPGDAYIFKVSQKLGVAPEIVPYYMIKKEGDLVQKDEPIAHYRAFFGLIDRLARSPLEGTVESISNVTGRVMIRGPSIEVVVRAYISGRVIKVFPREGALIETNGTFIQGIFGIGGETHGLVKVLVESLDGPLTADVITTDNKGQILVGGSLVTLEALRKAAEVGAAGIVVGGIRHKDLKEFMGQEIGIAITGQEDVGLTLILTEGFGKMAMSRRTFSLLKDFEGHLASINGATQIRAGVIRPEIIIPHKEVSKQSSRETELSGGMVPGTLVRIISEPYFGAIGRVVSLPVHLQEIETESQVRVMRVELEDGREVITPRANAEIIEE